MEITCEGITGKYDRRNLTISKSGKNKYPSKKMFLKFLEKYEDIDGTADIWSSEDLPTGEVTIHVKVKYITKPKEA